MANILDTAKDYKPTPLTKNIADLEEVSVDMEIVDDEFEMEDKATGKPKTITQQVIVIDEEKYRCPKSVIQQLKVIVEDNPAIKKFKVKKTGTTKDDTRYQVIPLV